MAMDAKDPELYLEHAGFAVTSDWRDAFYRHAHGHQPLNPAALRSAALFKAAIPDLRKAAELKPKDCSLIWLPAYLDYFNAMKDANPLGKTNFTADMLPDTTKRSLHSAMTRLENLSQEADVKTAADAIASHGILNMMMSGDQYAAIGDFKRAVALDPTRDELWDMWLGCSKDSVSLDEMRAICESRLKSKDCPRNRLLLARMMANQQQWDKAKELSESALKVEPDNLIAHLMMVAVILRQSTDDQSLEGAETQLAKVADLLSKMPEGEEYTGRRREYILNAVIVCALDSDADKNKYARTLLGGFLKECPDDERGKDIQQALGTIGE